MGPITLFDKSFLQSLSLDESVWFDHLFLTNISPLFFVETLADLEKHVRSGRTPEKEVRIIADKTPQMHSSPNAFHSQLCVSDLLGNRIPMDGRILARGGRSIKTADQTGIVFEISPEAEAFSRWQKHEFIETERLFAKKWRLQLRSLDFEHLMKSFDAIGISASNCKTTEEVKSIADFIVQEEGYSFSRFKFFMELLNIPEKHFLHIFNRWGFNGCPPFNVFAPYAAHVLTIELFFSIATASKLISLKKISNKVDLAYLFYLPFCMLFVSSDKLHRRCSPLFLRDDQDFVWGQDLKDDLRRIEEHYSKYSESDKEMGLNAIASCPPREGNFLVSRLWDRHLPTWRSLPERSFPRQDTTSDELVSQINQCANAKTVKPEHIDFDSSDPDVMVVKRRVQKKKGKWWQLPIDIEDDDDW